MNPSLETLLADCAGDLNDIGVSFAVVGGVAVSAQTEPRFTRDIDLAIGVKDDSAAEQIIYQMFLRGYRPPALSENT